MKRKDRTAEKRQPILRRSSRGGSAPPRLSVWFSALFLLPFRGVCLAAAPERGALVYAKHTPWCQIGYSMTKSVKIIFCLYKFQIWSALVILQAMTIRRYRERATTADYPISIKHAIDPQYTNTLLNHFLTDGVCLH